ncbi:MAG: hypothetical protein ACO295_05105 [Sediminibacterium sp.]
MITGHCSWCENDFVATSKNQIYCSVDCRTEATKVKVVERYSRLKSKKRQNKVRLCAGGCGTQLNIYNDIGFCDICSYNKRKLNSFLKEIKEYFDYEEK